jgi:hypothetical protein
VSSTSSNFSLTIYTSGTIVRPDEVVILVIVFSLWGWAIALFIHRLHTNIVVTPTLFLVEVGL